MGTASPLVRFLFLHALSLLKTELSSKEASKHEWEDRSRAGEAAEAVYQFLQGETRGFAPTGDVIPQRLATKVYS